MSAALPATAAAQTRPLLALDAAGQACSAALWQPGQGLLAHRFEHRARFERRAQLRIRHVADLRLLRDRARTRHGLQ